MTTLFTAQRLDSDGMSSIARWSGPDGEPLCFCLEPGGQRLPHPGVPPGTYRLTLRAVGEKHAEYLKRYGSACHKGMVEMLVPGRDAIEFHVGNTIADTLGCSLAGESFLQPPGNGSGHYEVTRSRAAYDRVYPILRDAILAGPAMLRILSYGMAQS